MKRILHITESLGGGVATALQSYVLSARQHKHFLLGATRDGTHDTMTWANAFIERYKLPRPLFSAIKAIRSVYNEIKPDYIHLHSSFAGAYGRAALLPRSKIIYTPHCYAFERTDIGKPQRLAYWLAEHILSAGGGLTAGVSPREVELAKGMLFPQQTFLLPNSACINTDVLENRAKYQRGERLKVAMVGRITIQKDPDFFTATVKHARSANLPVDFIWLGGGDDKYTGRMIEAGARVTGWLQHHEIIGKLAECDVYYHTASWEAAPMSILEAARLGLTLVCRNTPSVVSLPITPSIDTPQEAAQLFGEMAAGKRWEDFNHINGTLNARYSHASQQAALEELYGL